MSRGRTFTRRVLPVILFPWGVARLFGWPFRILRESAEPRAVKRILFMLQILVQVLFAIPVSVLIAVELAMFANRFVVGESAQSRLVSDHVAGVAANKLQLPGEPAPDNPLPAEGDDDFDQRMVEAFAPVVIHETAHKPLFDIPLDIEFDGTLNPRDNPTNLLAADSLVATVHGELTAITGDSYYLTYSLYHAADYDHPMREWLSRWTYHDNDNEGLHIRVDRATGEVRQVETWYHNRFVVCSRDPTSTGTEPISANLQFEGVRRVIILAQAQGHGVRCAQKSDQHLVEEMKVMRPRLGRKPVAPRPDRDLQVDVTYEIASFDLWYEHALSFRSPDGLLADSIPLGGPGGEGGRWVIGRYISGHDREDVGWWARPKPPWSWDDFWDDLPIVVWHFLPSLSFEDHTGVQLSHDYEMNRPLTLALGTDAETFMQHARLPRRSEEGDKWLVFEAPGTPERGEYLRTLGVTISRYINRVFLSLG